MSNPHLADLLQKQMSRKEFLGLIVLAVGSLFGFGTIIKLLTGKSLGGHKSLGGYSSNGYGK